jgi:hypothetical protein
MTITIKRSNPILIDNIDDFIKEVNKIINNLNNENIPILVLDFYNVNKNINTSLKKFKIMIKSLFYNKTVINKEYWISRGWSYDTALDNIRREQKERSKKSKIKMMELKNTDEQKWKSKNNTYVEFYLSMGYTLEESILMRSKRQSTFSKDKCVKKYGDEIGEKVWRERQKKWIGSMSSFDSSKKDSTSISFFKKKYGEDWILQTIDRNFICNKNLIKVAIMNSNNLDTFIENIYNNKNIYSVNELVTIFNSKILQTFFNVDGKELKSKILSRYGLIPTKYGNIRYFNNHICRSNGEFYIAKKLKEIGIDYEYEKRYPNSTLISDFYIKDKDLYVEYLGFLKNDFLSKHNKDIFNEYNSRVDKKKLYCEENNIRIILNSDYRKIINEIINYD